MARTNLDIQLRIRRYLWRLRDVAVKLCHVLIPVLWLLTFFWVIYDVGFNPFRTNNPAVNRWLLVLLRLLVIFMGIRWLVELTEERKLRSRLVALFFWLVTFVLYAILLPEKIVQTAYDSGPYFLYKSLLYGGIGLLLLTEASLVFRFIKIRKTNPAFVFVISFAVLIICGTLLLHLPNATKHGIRTIDAFFTATSSVCVTGLMVVDPATAFTPFGQVLLLVMIQTGGLGIMTFTGLLGYMLAGSISFRNELAFHDMFRGDRFGSVMRLVGRIVMVTLFFEAIGAALIYTMVSDDHFSRGTDKLFFAVFHAVSAFCNAGISTEPGGLYAPEMRFNYPLQLLIAALVVLGGLGFPIVFNLYTYIRVKAGNLWRKLRGSSKRLFIPRLININSRLALVTTGILLATGFVAYLVFEQSGTLTQHPTVWGKLVTCVFGSVMPRTGGFNTVDLSLLTLPAIMIYLLLMWIGASPGSTGGGIKTTTIAVAFINMVSIARGKDRSEFFRAEISNRSIQRAFAIMMLSLLFIGVSIFLVSLHDSDKGLVRIAFESFSAFSTAGMTLGITHELSDFSRLVLCCTMFTGRVGALTVVIALMKQSEQLFYRYPQEDITF